MLQTPRRKIQYPNPDRSDRPDVPAHMQILALALDVDVIYNSGLDSDRLAATHQVNGGRLWWSTDTQTMWYDDGTTWRSLGNAPINSPTFTGSPQAPTPPAGDSSTRIATTAFVAAFFPVGAVLPFAGGAAPTGWLLCDGSAVSRTTYASLFAVIGSTFGVGDGSTTFNIPDMRGRVPVGKNSGTFNTLGGTGGEETHVNTVNEMPSHTHTESAVSAGTPAGTINSVSAGTPAGTISAVSAGTPSGTVHSTVIGSGGALTESHISTSTGTGANAGDANAGDSIITNVFTGNALPTHVHTFTGTALAAHGHTFTGTPLGTHSHVIANTGGGVAHNNLQPYLTLNYLIKY
jgi:microcystin-dependent protein